MVALAHASVSEVECRKRLEAGNELVQQPSSSKEELLEKLDCCSCSLCAQCCEIKKWIPWLVLLFLRRNTTKNFLKLGMSCFSNLPSSKEELLEKLDASLFFSFICLPA